MGDAVAELLFGENEAAQDSCIQALRARINQCPLAPLDGSIGEVGSGIYLLFYIGNAHKLYNGLSADCPVYIGKALARTGSQSHFETRLSQHRKSVRAAEDLRLADFGVKVVSINEDWSAGCEAVLIKHWQPLWNTVLTGFGNHAPGRGRNNQRRSMWDTLHAGRRWAAEMEPEVPCAYAEEKVLEWCKTRGYPPIRNVGSALIAETAFNV